MPEINIDSNGEQQNLQVPFGRRLAYNLGLISLGRLLYDQSERTVLPQNYHFQYSPSATIVEEIFQWTLPPHQEEIPPESLWARRLKVGVREDGYEGSLIAASTAIYRGEHAEMGAMGVLKKARGLGMGKALIDERLRIIELAGISSIYIPLIENTNPLLGHYVARGFAETPYGELVKGPDPRPLRDWQRTIGETDHTILFNQEV